MLEFPVYFAYFTHVSSGEEASRIATIIIRGSTGNIMDDIERAVDDAVNTYKALTKDPRFVPGAGATEIELAKQLTSYGEVCACMRVYDCSCYVRVKLLVVSQLNYI